jgi:hypothetical protein
MHGILNTLKHLDADSYKQGVILEYMKKNSPKFKEFALMVRELDADSYKQGVILGYIEKNSPTPEEFASLAHELDADSYKQKVVLQFLGNNVVPVGQFLKIMKTIDADSYKQTIILKANCSNVPDLGERWEEVIATLDADSYKSRCLEHFGNIGIFDMNSKACDDDDDGDDQASTIISVLKDAGDDSHKLQIIKDLLSSGEIFLTCKQFATILLQVNGDDYIHECCRIFKPYVLDQENAEILANMASSHYYGSKISKMFFGSSPKRKQDSTITIPPKRTSNDGFHWGGKYFFGGSDVANVVNTGNNDGFTFSFYNGALSLGGGVQMTVYKSLTCNGFKFAIEKKEVTIATPKGQTIVLKQGNLELWYKF